MTGCDAILEQKLALCKSISEGLPRHLKLKLKIHAIEEAQTESGADYEPVLAILRQEERYGYEISQNLERYGFGRIPEGTVYPLLLRLEKRGSITASFRARDSFLMAASRRRAAGQSGASSQ